MSGALSRIFVARLVGVAVFDPNGDQVGKTRDVVLTLRIGSEPPRVLGLVVEVPGRRRIFLPMTRVTAIDPGQVITTGLVNMRRFEPRPTETMAVAELLDRHVTLLEDGLQVTVVDLAIEQNRTRDWHVTKVHVRRPGKGLRRHGESFTVDWDSVSGLALTQGAQGAANLLATFERLNAADLAAVLRELSPQRRSEVAAALDDERLADVLEELPEDEQVQIIESLGTERAADVLEEMAPDDAADLLAELPKEDAERLLLLMEPGEAEPVRRLLAYGDATAGGLMTTEPVILPPDATVADALARVRRAEVSPALAAQVYVCRPPVESPTGKFLGIAHIQRLLREPPSTLVAGVIDTTMEPLHPDDSLAVVAQHLATYNLVAVPVVDDGDHLLGAVTVDDVLDHMLPVDWREGVPDAR